MNTKKILLIEDDELLGETLFDHLKDQFLCDWTQSLEEAQRFYQPKKYDVIVSDFKVNGGNSLDLLKEISVRQDKTPFIVISGYVDKASAIQFLNYGARFLIEKPFKLEELDLLLEKVFATTIKNTLEDKVLEILINNKAQSVHYKGQPIDLTPTEFRLLSYFLVHRGEAISKKELERTLWGEEEVSRNLIYTHIGNLKKKIPSVCHLVQVKKGSLFVEET